MVFCDKKQMQKFRNDMQNPERNFSIKDYDFIKILGQGAFAKVVQVRNKADGKIYAMKIIPKDKIMMKDEDDEHCLTTEELAARNMYRVRQIQSEKNIFKLLNDDPCPFIVKLHSAFTSTNYLYMVLDMCPGGDLFGLI
jgi:serine/threonine protein kinase